MLSVYMGPSFGNRDKPEYIRGYNPVTKILPHTTLESYGMDITNDFHITGDMDISIRRKCMGMGSFFLNRVVKTYHGPISLKGDYYH